MKILQYFFSFHGRFARRQFWLANVALAAMWLFAFFNLVFFGVADSELVNGAMSDRPMASDKLLTSDRLLAPYKLSLSVGVLSILALAACVAIGVKRLHDRDQSVWWLLVFFALPAALANVADSNFIWNAVGHYPQYASWLTCLALSLWGLVELGFQRGTSGENQYGADPIAI